MHCIFSAWYRIKAVCVCFMLEKSWDHKSKAFFTFIDMKKAYIRRCSIGKLGVPGLYNYWLG